jgi:hypothetical protein
MENKQTLTIYLMVIEDRKDYTLEVSTTNFRSVGELLDYYDEIWNKTHILREIKKVEIEG